MRTVGHSVAARPEQSGTPTSARVLNALTVDVEEHFQVSAFESVVSRSDWDRHPSRVEANTRRLLDLFDEEQARATFFVLGCVAEKRPGLVREIAARGHEIASHGWSHRLVYAQTREEFRAETAASKTLLEDLSGAPVRGYRAASFSITRKSLWALLELSALGFDYDSSVFPTAHDRYGVPGAPRRPYVAVAPDRTEIREFPPSTAQLGALTAPFGGGGYLRLFPLGLTRWAARRLNERERMSAVVYLHPWEVDPDQPRIAAPPLSRFRHYTGLRTTEPKLRALLREFRFAPMAAALDAAGELPRVALDRESAD